MAKFRPKSCVMMMMMMMMMMDAPDDL